MRVTFDWTQATVNGETFGVVRVPGYTLRDPNLAKDAIALAESMMETSPVALMVLNRDGSITFAASPSYLLEYLQRCDSSKFIWQKVTRELDPLRPWPFVAIQS